VSGSACDNCGVSHGPDDIFCENCGYDFITGSLPREDEHFPVSSPAPVSPGVARGSASSPGPPPVSASRPVPGKPPMPGAAPAGIPPAPAVELISAPIVNRVRFEITVDRPYFETVVAEGELDFPDPVPESIELEVAGTELHIGRTSESRAIHPDLDVADLTGDPAVSSRHAVIRVTSDGRYTITDVGSTNGTFVGSAEAEPITVGQPVALEPGMPVFVGAWTRLSIPAT
jgi:hypothetical protein